jgi:hypothetical protein
MAEQLIEQYLDQVGQALHVRGPYRDRVLTELRSHLEDAADRGEASGLTRQKAAQAAIDQLGAVGELVAGVRPRATRLTRILAGLPVVGLVLAAGSIRGANELHETGGRLWLSVPSTTVWLVGWLSILLMGGPLIALFVRHRGVLGRIGIAAAGAVTLVAAALLAFHFSNDGSFTRGDPSTWRSTAIATAGLATVALVVMIRRAQLIPNGHSCSSQQAWPSSRLTTSCSMDAAAWRSLEWRASRQQQSAIRSSSSKSAPSPEADRPIEPRTAPSRRIGGRGLTDSLMI